MNTNLDRIREALQVLAKEGAKSYNDPASAETYQAAGLALAAINDNATDILHLAYSFLEDWNQHAICSVLGYIRPQLYGDTLHVSDLPRLESMLNRRGVTLRTEYDPQSGEYKTKKINVRIVFEDAKEE